MLPPQRNPQSPRLASQGKSLETESERQRLNGVVYSSPSADNGRRMEAVKGGGSQKKQGLARRLWYVFYVNGHLNLNLVGLDNGTLAIL